MAFKNHLRRRLRGWTGWDDDDNNDYRLSFVEGLSVGIVIMTMTLLVDYGQGWLWHWLHSRRLHGGHGGHTDSHDTTTNSLFSPSALLQWIPYLHQVMGLAAIGFELFRRGRFVGQQRGNFGRTTYTREQQQAKMNKMINVVHKVPLEGFVVDEDVVQEDGCNDQNTTSEDVGSRGYSSISISVLQQMLKRRGVSQEEIDSFVDRQNLVDRLKQCRQYSDTCCICFEPYEEGEPIRVLPKCHHELHVDCLDKWVYTFANNPAKLQHDPTCPLCKEGLTCITTRSSS